jgi:hypothetical protein
MKGNGGTLPVFGPVHNGATVSKTTESGRERLSAKSFDTDGTTSARLTHVLVFQRKAAFEPTKPRSRLQGYQWAADMLRKSKGQD